MLALLIHSVEPHRSLIYLLYTACFARALHCDHSFAHSRFHLLPSFWESFVSKRPCFVPQCGTRDSVSEIRPPHFCRDCYRIEKVYLKQQMWVSLNDLSNPQREGSIHGRRLQREKRDCNSIIICKTYSKRILPSHRTPHRQVRVNLPSRPQLELNRCLSTDKRTEICQLNTHSFINSLIYSFIHSFIH